MSKASILIVEDEGIIAENLTVKLKQLGYTVVGAAAKGHEAVEMAMRLRPDLILMDIKLDGEMDGIQAAEEIRTRYDVPVIYLTAHSDPATLARAKITGPFGYILKPFEIRDLATQIELALYKHRADRQVREQREWLRVTLTSIGDAVIATDAGGKVAFLNPIAEDLTGWPIADAVGRPVREVFHIVNETTRMVVEDPVNMVLQSGKIVGLANHTVLLRREGGEVPIDDSGAPIVDGEGRILGVVLVFRDITGRKAVEEALRASERRLIGVLESMPDAFVSFDADMRYTYVNTNAERLQAARREELLGKDVRVIYPDAESCKTISQYERVIREQKPVTSTSYHAGFDRWVEVRAFPTPDGVSVFYKDVSAQVKAEAALRESEQRFRLALRNAPVSVAAQDRDLKYIWAYNQRTAKPEEIIGRSDQQIFTPEEAAHITAIKRRVLEEEVELREQMWLNRPGGRMYLDICWEPIHDESGNVTGVASAIVDLTPIKLAEEEQRTSRERLELLSTITERLLRAEDPQVIVEELCRLVMDHLECQFFFNYLVEEPGKSMHLNACAGIPPEAADTIRQLDFGVAVCGCVARDCRRIIAEDIQNTDDMRTRLMKSFGVQAYCCHPLMAQGELTGTLSFGTRTRPTFTEDEVALMKAVCDHVAVAMQRLLAKKELRRLNETLEQQVAERTALAEARAKQLQALAVEMIEAEERERRRIAVLLHEDLQQILAASRFQLQTVRRSLPDQPILLNVERLLEDSISKSRTLSHELSPPVLHQSGLISALKSLTQQMSEQFGLYVRLETGSERKFDHSSVKVFLYRAVQELLFNVTKHAGVKSAHVNLSGSDGSLAITVSDQGRGFDPSALNSSGVKAGFGLITLRERARYIGGDLSIESAPGKGSRFTLTVPLSMDIIGEKQLVPEIEKPLHIQTIEAGYATKGIRVLFADDHKVMRQGLISMLADRPDIQVVGEAANGREAIEKARQLKPDVVVMDIAMPEMDGVEATRRIKTEFPEVRIIGLSMYEDELLAKTMRQAGAEAFLSKTASSGELLKAIYGQSAIGSTAHRRPR
jgi:PAS domain S-box-containing protein